MPAIDYAQIAAWYDSYVTTQMDVPFFIEKVRGCSAVLELTCGTGRLSLPLLQAGTSLTCLDASPEMLAMLDEKLTRLGLSATLVEMDITALELDGRFDCILFPFNTFGELHLESQQRQALQGIRAHLAPGGRFICTLHNPAVRLRAVDGEMHVLGRFRLPDGESELVVYSRERYDPHTRLVTGVQEYEQYNPEGVRVKRVELPLCFRLHTREEFETLAAATGFLVEAMYGDYDFAPYDPARSPFMIWSLIAGD